jgi:predicted RNA-binding Zn-ribbon protein involved in translation (DUF1610 family)
MKCVQCGAELEHKALEEHLNQKKTEAYTGVDDKVIWAVENDGEMWDISESDDLAAGSCPSCGAELFGDKNTIAMVCPCCGNAQIVAKRISSMLKPDYVIPFKRDKAAAQEALTEFCNDRRRLLPKTFMVENRIEGVQGIYAPFWLFDAQADGWVMFEAVKIRTEKSGKDTYTTYDYYSVERKGSLAFEKIPVDGSEKMDDKYMDAIEPFNFRDMQEFHPSYLAGYAAEKYDVDAEECKRRAGTRIKNTIENKFKNSVKGYDRVTAESSLTKIKNGTVSYGLFPVWVLNTKYNNENYLFMMNGQTGVFAGKLPVDNGKVWAYKARYTGIISVTLALLIYLILFVLERTVLADGSRPGDYIGLTSSPIIISIIALGSLIFAVKKSRSIVSKWEKEMDTATLSEDAFGYDVPGSLCYTRKKDEFFYTKSSDRELSWGDLEWWWKYFRKKISRAVQDEQESEVSWEELLRKKPDDADSKTETLRRGSHDVEWTEPLRKKPDDEGLWTVTPRHKRSFDEIEW